MTLRRSCLALLIFLVSCSSGGDGSLPSASIEDESTTVPASSAGNDPGAGGDTTVANPGTILQPAAEPEEDLLPIEAVVALLDACVADPGLVGPCHCAFGRLEASFVESDLVVFEDRFRGQNLFVPEIAAALSDCQEAAAPAAWSALSVSTFINGCTKGSDRLADACRCAVDRGREVIPEGRVADFAASEGVVPGYVELINDCL